MSVPYIPFCAGRRSAAGGSCLFGHRDQVVAGHLADQLGMIGAHVRLDRGCRLVDGLAVSEEPALAPDDLRHDRLLTVVSRTVRVPDCTLLRFSLHQHWSTTLRLE